MKKYIPAFVIILLISFHFYSNSNILRKKADFGGTDTVNHLIHRIDIHNGLKKILTSAIPAREKCLQIYDILHQSGTWPPMVYLISYLISSIFDKSTLTAELSNILYVAILIIGVYFLGRKIGGRNTGLLAAFITSSFPIVSIWSRRYGLDFPLTSLTPWLMLALLNTGGFTKIKSSFLFGLFLGFATLFKIQILIFIFGPLLYIILTRDRDPSFHIPGASQIRNLIISLGLAVLVFSLWWNYTCWNRDSLGQLSVYEFIFNTLTYKHQRYDIYIPPCPVFSWEGFYYYSYATKIGFFYIFIFILAFLHSFLRKDDRHNRNMLLIWALFPYLLFSIMTVKQDRWYYPSLPGIALFISLEINRLPLKKTKRWLIILIMLFGLIRLLRSSFLFQMPPNYKKSILNAPHIVTLMKEGKFYKRDAKLAICVFDGDRITFPKWPLNHERLLICIYNIRLNDPEVRILNVSKDDLGITDADLIILLLDFAPQEMLSPDASWQLNFLEGNILSKQQLSRMLNINKLKLSNVLSRQESVIVKKITASNYPQRVDDYLFISQIRLYCVSRINKGAMTVDQYTQLLKLPRGEIASWVDDYNRGGPDAVAAGYQSDLAPFNAYYTERYTKQLNEALVPLLKYFRVVEENINSDYNVLFLAKKNNP